MFRSILGARALLAAGVLVMAAVVTPAAGRALFEPAYYDDQPVFFRVASMGSANPNQTRILCFDIGPDTSTTGRAASVPTLYAVFAPGATHERCPDGSSAHDHVLSAVPGSDGYNGAVRIVAAIPTGSFNPAVMPITSAAEVEALAAAGQLTLADTGITMIAHVVRGRP